MNVNLKIKAHRTGWHLCDNDKPSFWFLDRDSALKIALMMANTNTELYGTDVIIEAETPEGGIEVIECRFRPSRLNRLNS